VPARTAADACPGVFAPHDAADGALARIRLPGGAVAAAALRVVADCAEELGDGRVHLTSRGNLQLRGLSRTPVLAARLAAVGLLPSATHERVRNVLASPLSGVAGGLADVRALAAGLDRGLCARPALAGLPGRFLFALDDGRGDVAAEDPDLCWRAPGTLLVAGVDTGLPVPVDDAVAALLDAAEAFLALRAADGGAAWRAAELPGAPARIAAALTEGPSPRPRPWQQGGPAGIQWQQGGPAGVPAAAAPPAIAPPAASVPGSVRRDDGGTALVVAPLLGELAADQLRLLADAATPASGPPTSGPPASGPAVVTPWRTVVLPRPRRSADALAAAGLVVAPGPAAALSACAGRPGCAKALADVRADARAALGRLPPRRVHVSGCARRCGAPRGEHVDAVARAGGGYLVDGSPRPGLVG
jgi:precorrin-3B synthase